MKIRYLGHSSFQLIESTGTTIVTDPYSDKLGCAMPGVTADAVTVSHRHYDHDAVEKVGGSPVVIDKEGSYDLPGVEINSIKSYHDNEEGRLRGENIIFKFSMDGIEVCHLGDIGEECSTELIEKALCHISEFVSIRIGDIIAAELARPDILVSRKDCRKTDGNVTTARLYGSFCGNPSFDFNIIM